jgi:PAS domain S-box-containing protein
MFLLVSLAASAQDTQVTIGVLAFRGEQNALKRWSPTAEYLTQKIPGYHFDIKPLTLDEMRLEAARERLDFVLTNPGNYFELEHRYGVSRLVTLQNLRAGRPYTVFGAVVITRSDRKDIERLSDLKGKSFMAVSPDAFGGFQLAWRELKVHGVDPFSDFSSLVFHGFPQDGIVYAVRDRQIDAGTVRTDILERMASEGKIQLDTFRILNPQTTPGFPFTHSTRLYPEWPFAKARHTHDDLAQQVAVALLSLPNDHPAAKAGNYAGWTVPLDYRPVEDLFKELQIGPYKHMGSVTLGMLLRTYWAWFLLGTILLFLMMATTGYVLQLNHKLNSEIRERRRTEAEMRKLSSAVEQTADIVVITTPQGIIEYVNSAFEKTTGYTRSEAIGHTPGIVRSGVHDQKFYAELWHNILQGKTFQQVFVNRRKDNSLFFEQKTITPLRDTNNNIVNFISTGKDVTEHRLAEERAREHQAALAHALRVSTMGEMASAIAHELNQPLAAIMNYAQGCIRRLRTNPTDSQTLAGALEQIAAQGQRAGEIIRRLREFVRKGEPHRARININEIVKGTSQFAALEAKQKGVTMRLDLSDHLPPVFADDIQIEQVLLNLVRNAIEVMRDELCPRRELTIRTQKGSNGEVEVSVHDTGPGLAPETVDRLFDAFYSTKSDGMGMGLSISRSIIEAHGGRLTAASHPHGGAIFMFTIPTADRRKNRRRVQA